MGIAQDVLGGIVDPLREQAIAVSSQLMTIVEPLASVGMAIYIMFWGLAVATGKTDEPFSDGAKRIMRTIFIMAIAFTADGYTEYVVDFFMKVPPAIAGQVVGGTGQNGLAEVIDKTMDLGFKIANGWIIDIEVINIPKVILHYIVGGIIGLLTLILCCIATATVFLAYMSLTIMIAIGPMFIMMLIFDQTKRFFDGWLGQVITFSVLFVIVAVACMICMLVLEKNLLDDNNHEFLAGLASMAFLIAMIVVMMQVQGMASAIGGGVSMQSLSIVRQVAGNVAGAAGGAAKMAGGAAKTLGKVAGVTGRARKTHSPN